jgi:hypothetical protein
LGGLLRLADPQSRWGRTDTEASVMRYSKRDKIAAAKSILLTKTHRSKLPELFGHAEGCELVVGLAIDEMEKAVRKIEEGREVRSGRTKADLKKLSAGLKRANHALNRLPSRVRTTFDGAELEKFIRRADRWASVQSSPPYRVGVRQRVAVAWAEFLLLLYEHKTTASRQGKHHKLAAILFGNPDADLYNVLVGTWAPITKTRALPNNSKPRV